jgi:hypothetical protein
MSMHILVADDDPQMRMPVAVCLGDTQARVGP